MCLDITNIKFISFSFSHARIQSSQPRYLKKSRETVAGIVVSSQLSSGCMNFFFINYRGVQDSLLRFSAQLLGNKAEFKKSFEATNNIFVCEINHCCVRKYRETVIRKL